MPELRADRDFEPVFTMLRRTFGWVTLPHVDDDFATFAKVRPGLRLTRGQRPTL